MSEAGPEVILREHILAEIPEQDGTVLIVQRHEQYIRDKADPRKGSLLPDAAIRANEQTARVFREMIEQVPEDMRQSLDVMVVASPTQYDNGGRRSLETASQVLGGMQQVFEQYHLSSSQLLNNQGRLKLNGRPIQSGLIVEPKIFNDNPDFVQWLKDNYGDGAINTGFFAAYEADKGKVRKRRILAGAEGPMDMANRLANYLYALKLYSDKYHKAHPGRRLLIWTVSHYDTISPYIQSRIGGGNDEGFLGVDYGAGFAINLKPDGTSTTTIGEKTYPISLVKAATASSID